MPCPEVQTGDPDEIPEVDEVLGTTAYDKILDAVDAALAGKQEVMLSDIGRSAPSGDKAAGNDRRTFCLSQDRRRAATSTAPTASSRRSGGDFRSVPMERLVKEAKGAGVAGREGTDPCRSGDHALREGSLWRKVAPCAAQRAAKISGIRWIRILYCYPEEITDELIRVMKEEPKVCHYLDLPIQHANDEDPEENGAKDVPGSSSLISLGN